MENIVNLPQVKKNLDQLAEILKRNPHFDLYELEEMEREQNRDMSESMVDNPMAMKGEIMPEKKINKDKTKTQVGIYLSPDIYKWAKYRALDEDTSLSGILESLLLEYRKKIEEKKDK